MNAGEKMVEDIGGIGVKGLGNRFDQKLYVLKILKQ